MGRKTIVVNSFNGRQAYIGEFRRKGRLQNKYNIYDNHFKLSAIFLGARLQVLIQSTLEEVTDSRQWSTHRKLRGL